MSLLCRASYIQASLARLIKLCHTFLVLLISVSVGRILNCDHGVSTNLLMLLAASQPTRCSCWYRPSSVVVLSVCLFVGNDREKRLTPHSVWSGGSVVQRIHVLDGVLIPSREGAILGMDGET